MERQRNVDGDELRMSKREQADRCNEALRKVYAEKKEMRLGSQQLRCKQIRQDARRRGFEFHLTQAKLEEITGEDAKCYHCHGTNDGRPLGADRIDPNVKAYTDDGVVPSCSQCNISRNLLGMDAFHQACKNVANYELSGENAKHMVPYTMPFDHRSLARKASSYEDVERGAAKRKLAFELTNHQYQKIRRKPCHYCGLHSKRHIGIDRLDNSQGYTCVNSRPCCTACNMMKYKYSRDSFVAMCVAVARAHP